MSQDLVNYVYSMIEEVWNSGADKLHNLIICNVIKFKYYKLETTRIKFKTLYCYQI